MVRNARDEPAAETEDPAPNAEKSTVEHTISLTLEEVAAGCVKDVRGEVVEDCVECSGSGLLFQWRKLERQGALTAVSAGEAVALASELAAARAEIAKLQRVLGKKTLENEILKEAVAYAAEKSGLRARPCCPGTTSENGLSDGGAGALACARSARAR